MVQPVAANAARRSQARGRPPQRAADDAAGSGKSMRLGRGVDVAPSRPAAALHASGGRIDGDFFHVAKMDHEAAIAGRVAGIIVPTSAHSDFQPASPGRTGPPVKPVRCPCSAR